MKAPSEGARLLAERVRDAGSQGKVADEAKINTLTVMIMEVPCCGALPVILKKAMEVSGVTVPVAVPSSTHC